MRVRFLPSRRKSEWMSRGEWNVIDNNAFGEHVQWTEVHAEDMWCRCLCCIYIYFICCCRRLLISLHYPLLRECGAVNELTRSAIATNLWESMITKMNATYFCYKLKSKQFSRNIRNGQSKWHFHRRVVAIALKQKQLSHSAVVHENLFSFFAIFRYFSASNLKDHVYLHAFIAYGRLLRAHTQLFLC